MSKEQRPHRNMEVFHQNLYLTGLHMKNVDFILGVMETTKEFSLRL